MNATTTVQTMLAAMPKASDREALIKAHEAAHEFHEAMADALVNEREIEDTKRIAIGSKVDWSDIIEEHEKAYAAALGLAAGALQAMPVKWAAVLAIELEAATPASSAAPKLTERCPTCGEHVASIFDHVDRDEIDPATGFCKPWRHE